MRIWLRPLVVTGSSRPHVSNPMAQHALCSHGPHIARGTAKPRAIRSSFTRIVVGDADHPLDGSARGTTADLARRSRGHASAQLSGLLSCSRGPRQPHAGTDALTRVRGPALAAARLSALSLSLSHTHISLLWHARDRMA
jgi:hypothetical protein